jgi:hemerythrin HHE cation binding domain-containing protein
MGKYVEQGKEAPHAVANDDPRAIALLKEEHQIFRQLFDRAEEAEGEAVVPIARELCMRLEVHMAIEEEIFYPALEAVIDKDEINEGIVEHATGKAIVTELEQLNGTEELFKTKVHVLGEVTMHHVDEEDEDMFEDAKKAHAEGKIDLGEIGARLEARRQELFDKIADTGDEGETGEVDANEVETIGSASD